MIRIPGALTQKVSGSYKYTWHAGLLIADEAALKQVWEDKGSSGTKLCILRQNVVSDSSKLHSTDPSRTLVSHVESNKSRFVLQTDESILEAASHLAAQKPLMNKGQFKLRQFALGLNFVQHGCLFSQELAPLVKPVATTMFDWMHNFVVGGVFHVEMTQLLKVLGDNGVAHANLPPGFFWKFLQ